MRPIVQQAAPAYFPSWIKRTTVAKEGGKVTHAVIDNAPTLVYLANQAVITSHTWLSRADKPDRPDLMIFDLDPPEGRFASARDAALVFRDVLRDAGLSPFLKTTGSKGLHVVVPIVRRYRFDEVRAYARGLAEDAAAQAPRRFTLESRKAKREGRLYLDILRNGYGQTAVAPYAVRARKGAPVAAPITWDELTERGMRGDRFGMRDMAARIRAVGDLWRDLPRHAKPLPKSHGERAAG